MLEIMRIITDVIVALIQPLNLMVLTTMISGKLTAKKEIKEIICYSCYILVVAFFTKRIIPAPILFGIITIIVIGYLIILYLETDYKTKIKFIGSIIILYIMLFIEMGKSYEIIVNFIICSLLILNVILLLILPFYHLYINNIKSKLIYLNVITSGASLSVLLSDDDLRNEKFLIYLVIVTIVTKIFRKISDNVKIGMYLVAYIIYLILKISKLDIRELDINYIILLTPLIPLILIIIGIKKEKKATVKELDIITMMYFMFYSFWEVIDSAAC